MDVVDGYVSIEAAAREYGVVVTYVGEPDAVVRTPDTYTLDLDGTNSLRNVGRNGSSDESYVPSSTGPDLGSEAP